ncbi:uncharacterized protein CLUP02_16699 [Colletotrichum lupini]|uniref:Uncharacterized protein n=1 Tax=Colletotrichum lupini TaxID=145971 RepID=A0A9Q8T987_9PEZI|nr:uncharacterized protein CLUP02_16699 [Colletotrichum lupini]UQC91165.1 hypothetical protein CLUP02_16699 [Colletotrichum lupini]
MDFLKFWLKGKDVHTVKTGFVDYHSMWKMQCVLHSPNDLKKGRSLTPANLILLHLPQAVDNSGGSKKHSIMLAAPIIPEDPEDRRQGLDSAKPFVFVMLVSQLLKNISSRPPESLESLSTKSGCAFIAVYTLDPCKPRSFNKASLSKTSFDAECFFRTGAIATPPGNSTTPNGAPGYPISASIHLPKRNESEGVQSAWLSKSNLRDSLAHLFKQPDADLSIT